MKIAIIGTRGVPGRYGGFETLAEQLAIRLSDQGHQVTVYCRSAFASPTDDFDPRVRRVILPGLRSKYLDTVFHTFLSVLHVITTDVEVALICNVANSPFAWIPRMFGIPTVLNVDGLDRKRRKWNVLGRAYLYLCELLSLITPTRLLTDSRYIEQYFRERYGAPSAVIAYGAEVPELANEAQSELAAREYILVVGRFEPENNLELILKAYGLVQTKWPLIVVGNNVYRPSYERELHALADSRVVFTGPVYGERYWELQRKAGIFIMAGEVGGTHPSLVEAMASGSTVLFLETPENSETVAEAGVSFKHSPADLAEKLQYLIASPGLREQLSALARERAASAYSWQTIANQYEALLCDACGHVPTPRPFRLADQEES
ncbi:MAG: glycosyltransferase [Terriglobales bacterium]|jgi:glycosyltransferase involved in cell wall biosynthesis